MKRFLMVAIVTLLCFGATNAQELTKEDKELLKISKKEAKELEKDGWKTTVGDLSIEKQLLRCYKQTLEITDDGYDRYIIGTGMAQAMDHRMAVTRATQLCQADAATKLSNFISSDKSGTVHKVQENLILGRKIILLNFYRIKDEQIEVIMKCGYDFAESVNKTRQSVK